jgi:antitoxin Phd
VTRRGEEVVVVISARDYRRLTGPAPDCAAFLLAAPDLGRLNLRRPADPARTVEL